MKMDDRDDLDPRRSMQQQGHAGGASQTSSMPLPERTFGIMDSTSNRETPNPSTTCLPRSQRIESSSSHGYPIPPLELEDSDSLPHQADAVEEEPPRFSLFRTLLLCLLLTTTLAVGSAFDAKIQCLSHEMYYLLDLVDDDTVDVSEIVIMQEQIECVEMFSKVIKPVGAITLACGIAAVIFIHRHLRYTNSLEEHIKPPHFAGLVKLLLIFMPVLIIWTYGIFSIMLRPKKRTEGNGRNPYNSLAAVDQKGHIGDNANLFYLSWISEGIVVSMFYQMIVDCLRWSKFGLVKPLQQEVLISPTTSNRLDEITPVYIQIQNIIKSYARANRLSAVYKQRRKTLYQVMVKLRQRSGFWAATVCFCAVILASSGILYLEVLYPIANAQIYVKPSQFREVCAIVKYTSNNFPDEYCTRTSFTVLSGIISCALSLVALLLHWIVRRRTEIDASSKVCGTLPAETHHYALWSELITSFLLSVLLGVNAVFATGVQGPAVNVGNMYYASWISFLLCLRICLGCLEEVYRAEINSDDEEEKSDTAIVPEREKDIATISKSLSSTSLRSSVKDEVATPQYRLERTSRLRLYLCLSVFSTVCSASAWDSAFNQESSLSKNQLYVMIAPALVALVSGVMFLLCLRPRGYSAVANLWIGGIISLICFAAWFADLIITMHSQDSWAVNSIGEIRMANLYYFSWASIITAGLQLYSYMKVFLGEKSKDIMLFVWSAIVKVCFVILGAALHIWYKVGDKCYDEENEGGAVNFCNRTIFAIVVACTGIAMGWFILFIRGLGWPFSRRVEIHIEGVISVFLVLLFGVTVALVTGIGGPGQSVGDLYYSVWLAFWVTIAILASCYDQMKMDEIESAMSRMEKQGESSSYYVGMEDQAKALDGAMA